MKPTREELLFSLVQTTRATWLYRECESDVGLRQGLDGFLCIHDAIPATHEST